MENKLKIDVNENDCLHTSFVVSPSIIAKDDSAASNHYWRQEDSECLEDVKKFAGPSLLLPNSTTIVANQRGQLPLSPELSKRAQTAMILPTLKAHR